jgi:uncharacterized CHY-type Zn-finger protein
VDTIDLDNSNIQSVVCGTCGKPVTDDTDENETNECPDCASYWIKEQIFRHFY